MAVDKGLTMAEIRNKKRALEDSIRERIQTFENDSGVDVVGLDWGRDVFDAPSGTATLTVTMRVRLEEI